MSVDTRSRLPRIKAQGAVWETPAMTGVFVALLIVCIVVLETFDGARDTILAVRAAAGDDAVQGAGPDLRVAWLTATFIAVAVAFTVAYGLVKAVAREADLVVWAAKVVRALVVTLLTIGLWAAWSVTGAVMKTEPPWREPMHIAVIVLAIVTVFIVAGDVLGSVTGGWRRATVVRVHMLLLAVLYAVFFIVPLTADQSAEVLRAWGDAVRSAAWPRILFGVAGALLLGVAIRGSARRLLAMTPAGEAHDNRMVSAVGALVGAAALVATAVDPRAIWIALALAGLAVAASKPGARRPDPTKLDPNSKRLADTLGLVPLLILMSGLVVATTDSWLLHDSSARGRLTWLTLFVVGLFALVADQAHRAGDDEAQFGGRWYRLPIAGVLAGVLGWLAGSGSLFVAALLLLAAIAVTVQFLLGRDPPLVLITVAGVAVGTTLSVYSGPVSAPRALGVMACAFIFTAGIVVALHAPAIWSAGRDLRRWSWMTPWPQQVPLVVLLAIWVAAAFAFAPPTPHQARTVPRAAATPIPIADAVQRWREQNASGPMLLVGASGGGTKAAYWTSLVLDCVLDDAAPDTSGECSPDADGAPDRVRRVFLTSSVSGGSIGVLNFVSHLRHDPGDAAWIDRRLSREVLSPLTAWGLVHDLPVFLLGAPTDPNRCYRHGTCWWHADRAFVQEASMAGFNDDLRGDPEEGLAALAATRPLPIFNGALNGGAGRLLASPLNLSPVYPNTDVCRAAREDGSPVAGALDAHDVLDANADLPLVTAALVSARFPVLEPPARVGTDAGGGRGCRAPVTAVRVRDGGYVENTGLLTIVDLLPAIRETLGASVPIVVLSIDDDAAVPVPNPVSEEQRPGMLSVTTRVSSDYLTRKARDTLCQTPGVTYLRISPPPHAGAHAATGWEISRTGRRDDLGRALAEGKPALDRVKSVRAALDGTGSAISDC